MLLSFKQRLVFFICAAVIGFIIANVAGGFILMKFPHSTAAMRIAAVCQSLFQLILPSIATAMVVTRRPATFLVVDKTPKVTTLLLATAALLASIPAMNSIISLNESITLPSSMKWLEDAMRTMEDNAAATISLLQGDGSAGDLLMNILIIGVLAGFGEELFFRGTLMRLMTTAGKNVHTAIWLTAILFSAIHLQFYGFVPRMLLGAYFGYLLYWSKSLWIPIAIHAANNIIYVTIQWVSERGGEDAAEIDNIGKSGDWTAIAASVALTAALLWFIARRANKDLNVPSAER